MGTGKILGYSVSAIAIIAVGSTFFGSWYTIDQGDKGVLLTNGALTEVVDPGLHFKIPFLQSIVHISLRQQVLSWTCGINDKSCDGAFNVMQAYSKDQQPADIKVTVNYHVPADKVAEVYTVYSSVDALGSRIIARKAPPAIKVVFGQFDAVSVIQNRAKFNTEAYQAVADSADGPVMVDSVQIENIDFSDAYEEAVEARMTAQVEVQKQEQQLAQEKIKASIAVTQAQGRADSVKAEADASAYKTKTEGQAAADAIKAKSGALASSPSLIELTKAERWDGKLPTSMIPGGTIPFLDVQQ